MKKEEKTELGKIEEQAGTIYAEKFMDKQSGKIESISNRDIAEELKSKGNPIEIRSAGAGSITEISLEPATVFIDQGRTATVKVKLEGPEDGNFYYDGNANNAENENDRQKAGISFQFKNFMTDSAHIMDSDNTNTNGWGGDPFGTNASDMRTDLEGAEGIGKLSPTLQSKIKQVKKKYLLGNQSSTVLESNEKLWLLSCSEIFSGPASTNNTGGFGYAKTFEGDRYQYYINLKETDTSGHEELIKYLNDGKGSATYWWLRSTGYKTINAFCDFIECLHSLCIK